MRSGPSTGLRDPCCTGSGTQEVQAQGTGGLLGLDDERHDHRAAAQRLVDGLRRGGEAALEHGEGKADGASPRAPLRLGPVKLRPHVRGDPVVEALLVELEGALKCLNQVANRVRQENLGAEAWRQHSAMSPESEMLAVFADIGRDSIDERRIAYAVRRFTSHRALSRARTPGDRAKVAAVIALEVNLEPLSIRYDELLDEFGLIGDPMGHALLLFAHGAEVAGYTGERLLVVLRRAWPEILGG